MIAHCPWTDPRLVIAGVAQSRLHAITESTALQFGNQKDLDIDIDSLDMINAHHLFTSFLVFVTIIFYNIWTFFSSVITIAVAFMLCHAFAESTALDILYGGLVGQRNECNCSLTFLHSSPFLWQPPLWFASSGHWVLLSQQVLLRAGSILSQSPQLWRMESKLKST